MSSDPSSTESQLNERGKKRKKRLEGAAAAARLWVEKAVEEHDKAKKGEESLSDLSDFDLTKNSKSDKKTG